jgi:hypothetical protein
MGAAVAARQWAAAEKIIREEVVEQVASSTEQGFQRRTRPLLSGQPPIIDVAQLHGLPLAVADNLRSNGRRPDATVSVCHGSTAFGVANFVVSQAHR